MNTIGVLTIEFTWEEPSSLINNSITKYTVKLNITLETSEYLIYENATTETLLVYNISQEGIHLCNISSVTSSVHANNKVGTGEAAKKTILPNIELCSLLAPSSVALSRVSAVPTLTPGLKVTSNSPTANRILLIYGMSNYHNNIL